MKNSKTARSIHLLLTVAIWALASSAPLTSRAQTTTNTFTTAGNATWTCPTGVSQVQVECWGGGGGGGGCSAPPNDVCVGGGAGGSYIRYTTNVNAGTVYNLTVGTGGGAGSTTGGAGGTGGSSYFGNTTAGNSTGALVLAVGGAGGTGNTGATSGTTANRTGGIAGGTATTSGNVPSSGAAANIAGTSGGTSTGGAQGTAKSGAGGAGAGPSGSTGGGAGGGAAVSASTSQAGTNGVALGGGGSGAANVTASKAGGAGGVGQVVLTYTTSSASAANSTVSANPTSVPADGTSTSTITVTMEDAGNNPVSGKTVTLASSRGGTDTISPASAVTSGSGVATFSVKSATGGSATFTATDTSDSIVVNQTAGVTFTSLGIDHFTVTPSSGTVNAGQVFTATVQAYNASNVAITDNSVDGTVVTMTGSGLVQFDSNGDGNYGDNTATLVSGALTINVRDLKAETVTITATAGAATGTSSSVTITPAAATQLQLLLPGQTAMPGVAPGYSGSASSRTAGASFNIVVNEVDTNWNVVSSSDVVHIAASGDANAILPANTPLSGGSVTLSVTNILAGGGRSLTASDVTSGGISSSTSLTYTVAPGPVTQMVIVAPGESATFGVSPGKTGSPNGQFSTAPYSVAVDALDAYYNLVTNSADVIGIFSSDLTATLPANTALVGGVKILSLTNNSAGTVTLTATNVTEGTAVAVGTTTVVVSTNATTTALASSVNPAYPGQPITFTATVNSAGKVTGTITFKNGASVLATASVSGASAIYTTSAGLGTYAISAIYSGDANNLASTSSTISEVVQAPGGAPSLAALMEDGQSYAAQNAPTGGIGPWSINSSSTVIGILTNDLSGATSPDLKSLPNNSTNPAAHLELGGSTAASREYYRSLSNNVSTGSVYFSMLMAAGFNPSHTDEVNMTIIAGGSNNAPSGLVDTDPLSMHTRNVDSTHYNIGIERLGGTTVWAPVALSASTTYLLVFKYTFGLGGTSDLFINPTPGGAEPKPSASATAGATPEPATIGTVLFFEGPTPFQTSGTASVGFNTGFNYDVMRADTNWADVTPGASGLGLASVAFSSVPQIFSVNTNSPLMTVTLLDASGNAFTATSPVVVGLKSSSPGGVFVSAVDGVTVITNVTVSASSTSASFYYSDSVAGNPTLTVSSGLLTPGTQNEIVNPPPSTLDHFTVTASTGSTTAGTVFSLTVQAFDSNNAAIVNNTLDGSVVTMSSSGAAQFDANGDGIFGDITKSLTNGALSINVKDLKAEGITFTATLGLHTGISSVVSITAGSPAQLQVLLPGESAAPGTGSGKTGGPTTQTAGTPFNIVVRIVDTNWNTVSNTDTVHVTGSGDAQIVLPADAPLSAGTITLPVTDMVAGSGYTLTVSDVSNGGISSSTSATYSVAPGAVSRLVVMAPGETATPGTAPGKTGTPLHQTEGIPFALTVNAYDSAYNLVTASSDTVGITTAGSRAVLPANSALAGGSIGFSVSHYTSGSVTDTASDITSPSVLTGSTTVVIDPVPQYRSVQSGSWEDTNTWQISFDGTTWSAATNTPTAANADAISITNGFTVTVNSPETIDQTVVASNSTLVVASGASVTVSKGFGTDLDVFGTVNNSGGLTTGSGAATAFEAGGTYLHNQDGGSIVTASWNSNATCAVTGWKTATTVTLSTGFKQKFGNFTWNSPSQTVQLSMGGAAPTNFAGNFNVISTGSGQLAICIGATINLNIGGSVNVRGGTLYAATSTTAGETETVNVAGDVNIDGGALNLESSLSGTEIVIWNVSGNLNIPNGTLGATSTNAHPTIKFVKSGTQTLTVSPSGSITAGNTLNWDVASNSVLDLGTNVVTGAGLFTVESGGGLMTANTSGLAGNLTLPSTNINLSTSGNYTYDGAMAQSGDNLMPATASNLSILNSLGVTLFRSETVGNLNLSGAMAGSGLTVSTGTLSATAQSTIAGSTTVNAGALSLSGSSANLPVLTVQTGSLNLGGGAITVNVVGTPLSQGNYLLVQSTAGGQVTGTPPLLATMGGAGLLPGLAGFNVISNASLYLYAPAFYAVADSAAGFFSGQNVWFTNVSGLSMFTWSSSNPGLAVSNWNAEGPMQEQTLNDVPGYSRYSINVTPAVSPTYYVAGTTNGGPYTLSPVSVSIITTADFQNFGVLVTNVPISSSGVLALSLATPATLSSRGVLNGGGFHLQFSGTSGHNYVVQASTNLLTWTNIGSGTFSNSPSSFADPSASGMPKRFYRIGTQ